MLTYLNIDNFKSLKEVRMQLPELSYFCGPNGSGKSNFAEACDFLSQTFRNGLAYAVTEKAGFYNMCFRRQRRSRGGITFQFGGRLTSSKDAAKYVTYDVSFELQTRGEAIRSDFYVSAEHYSFLVHSVDREPSELKIERVKDKYVLTKNVTSAVVKEFPHLGEQIDSWWEYFRPQDTELLGSTRLTDWFPFDSIAFDMKSIRVFRISPRTARGAGTPSISGELGKYGENLPSALDYMIAKDKAGFEQLQLWMKGVLPDLAYLKSDYTETKQLGLFLKETGVGAPWYAEDLSDGTLMSIALFIAILDSRNKCIFIEEPENSLHPWILRKFLECCQEISGSARQVLISTQSPIVVAMAKAENLFLIEKTAGRTNITGALSREPNLAKIIRNEFLDLGEYWLSGGLQGVPEAPALTDDLFNSTPENEPQ